MGVNKYSKESDQRIRRIPAYTLKKKKAPDNYINKVLLF